MDFEAWKARVDERATKRQAQAAKADKRAALVRRSLTGFKAGTGTGLGPLLSQQAQELRDERKRLSGHGEPGAGEPGTEVAEAPNGGRGKDDDG